jgi:hypothetical protein
MIKDDYEKIVRDLKAEIKTLRAQNKKMREVIEDFLEVAVEMNDKFEDALEEV